MEGEGFSDGFGDPCITEWFSSYVPSGRPTYEDLVCLRVLDNDMVYPDDASGSGHWDGQFWSGANWEVRQEIGQNESIELFMEALYLTPSNIANFTVLADTVTHADCALSDCTNFKTIQAAFEGKNIPVSALPAEFAALLETVGANETTQAAEELIPAPAFVAVVALVFASVVAVRARSRR